MNQIPTTEKQHHKNLIEFFHRLGEPRYPQLQFVKHTANEALGGGGTKVQIRTDAGAVAYVPASVLEGYAMGVRPGVWDFEYLGPNLGPIPAPEFSALPPIHPAGSFRGCAVELKVGKNTLSPDQERWQRQYQANGWYTAVFYHWCEAATFFVRWVGGDPAQFEGLLLGARKAGAR